MTRTRTARIRLGAAVTAVLAVTTVTAVTVTPSFAATAVTPAAAAQSAEQDVAPFPVDASVLSAGPTGFLSGQGGTQITYRWTRYADGVTTVLPGGSYGGSRRTDVVRGTDGSGVFKLYDMATGADPLEIDIRPLGEGYTVVGSAGTRLVAKKANATGGTDLHVIGKQQGDLVDDTVTGLPADAAITSVNLDSPDSAVVMYAGTVDGTKRSRAAVVDIATHTVVEKYETPDVPVGNSALSATHIAWVEKPTDSTVKVAVARRDTGETVRRDLGITNSVGIQLVGDWLTYRQFAPNPTSLPNSRYALRAFSLTTGETVDLLDHTLTSTPGPDGTQMARGGTIEHGEGLYRIAPGADGARPTVTLVASTGQSTTLEFVKHDVPETIDFDRVTTPVPLTWTLNRVAMEVHVELEHPATGKTWSPEISYYGEGRYGFKWDGTFVTSNPGIPAEYRAPAPNGDYIWRFTAQPIGGIGPAVEKTGTFKVVRKVVPHDFNDNGTPDLLVRDSAGLKLYNTSSPLGAWTPEPPTLLGTGWGVYDQLVSPGNVAGAPQSDIVARDKTGVLWLHQGTGHALAPRVKIGGGWGVYNKLTGGSDLNGDGRPDLLATDTAGVLWLYKGTGSATAPFAARVKVGGGWGIYNKITATDNIGGGPAGDLVARDTSGVLWLYLGKGDGTFAARTRIGAGWNTYYGLAGFGDVDRDGHPDLLANDDSGHTYVYKGTGDWRAPFGTRRPIYAYDEFGWHLTIF
ncbi:FG-GAP repeat domain-containing protein [Streptomyces vietnamensis]|uniref:FG-GAP repeat domain-containing protein n=1 Tax=Streptomyces vietnamensis TaxID=362257 RepID=UPI0037B6E88C